MFVYIYSLIIISIFLFLIILEFKKSIKNAEITSEKIKQSITEFSPEEFFEIRNQFKKSSIKSSEYDFSGVYILFNQTKNMHYVGQGKNVFSRVNNHFTGRGNGDVYADFKYGDKFLIRIIKFEESGFSSLNELERHTISEYQAYSKGYNKTKGNRG